MAKTPERVVSFLNDLSAKLDKLQEEEMAALKSLKKDEEGDAFDGKLNAWDQLYYRNKVGGTGALLSLYHGAGP